jgi:hypothetical protein
MGEMYDMLDGGEFDLHRAGHPPTPTVTTKRTPDVVEHGATTTNYTYDAAGEPDQGRVQDLHLRCPPVAYLFSAMTSRVAVAVPGALPVACLIAVISLVCELVQRHRTDRGRQDAFGGAETAGQDVGEDEEPNCPTSHPLPAGRASPPRPRCCSPTARTGHQHLKTGQKVLAADTKTAGFAKRRFPGEAGLGYCSGPAVTTVRIASRSSTAACAS